ncbi:MAG: precorrin-8X methylmutase [Alphaproteobacteria bacterium]
MPKAGSGEDSRLDHLRDPGEITRASYAAIRRATDLSGIPDDMEGLAIRLVHACGEPAIVQDLRWSAGAVAAGRRSLERGAVVLADSGMVAQGITAARLPRGNRVLCTLRLGHAAGMAARAGTTRSAAAVELWPPWLAGAVVAIGTAPTALFRLLEGLRSGWPRPAVVLGFPVGFIGAAESKDALVRHSGAVPYVTLLGRRGGSALAAAAVNALAGPAENDPP